MAVCVHFDNRNTSGDRADSNYNFLVDGARVLKAVALGSKLERTLDRATSGTTVSYLPPAGDVADVVNARGFGPIAFYHMSSKVDDRRA